ncbi:protein phosphatase CheZ [Rhodoferax antarcticus]|uniref:Protein phosphatase CheZ n=1 Tax=Rhodoferax antarcticus ANT.BR TaxID=1111071 RepID=A0A1Q8YGH7_9BURK|nr:protein phosphatase CheZ [Rhodoferax antarcticus]APW45606.1 chemotaxis protein CheZ [Rhodoferax antarcticus]MCW2312815.1 chemotaxis protein CheZ [Rhodoferax antarcticus]OLP07093.1 chemotaxis phosphatase CheZ [Rhodoferax antarcticus ANT.BR]
MSTGAPSGSAAAIADLSQDVHQRIGILTRQLHDSLQGLGLAEKVKTWAGELPDAKSRLTYIARLTGEAAEKVLNNVDQAKAHHDHIAAETRRIGALIVKDPVAAVAKGHVMNFIHDVEDATQQIDTNLTNIMMAQDFHDLTGQVISKVVALAANIEAQLLQLLIITAPAESVSKPVETPASPVAAETPFVVHEQPVLQGPVVNPEGNPDVVKGQSEVDDLLASLGF